MTQRIAESDGQFSTRGLQYKPDSGRSESKTQGDQNKLRLIQTQAGPCLRNNRQTNTTSARSFQETENRKQTLRTETPAGTHTHSRGDPHTSNLVLWCDGVVAIFGQCISGRIPF